MIGKGMPKPRNYTHMLPPDKVYHLDCGGLVKYDGSAYGDHTEWNCEKCKRKWLAKALRNLKPEQLGERFYMGIDAEEGTYVIVTATDGLNTFTKTVPAGEAHKYEKFPDPTKF